MKQKVLGLQRVCRPSPELSFKIKIYISYSFYISSYSPGENETDRLKVEAIMKDLFVKCYTNTQEKALLAAIKLLTGMSLFGVYYIIII